MYVYTTDWAGFTGYYIPDELWNMPVGQERSKAIDQYLFDVEVGIRNDFEATHKNWSNILIATRDSISIKDQERYRNEMLRAYASVILADHKRCAAKAAIEEDEDWL